MRNGVDLTKVISGTVLTLVGGCAAAEAYRFGLWQGVVPGDGLFPFAVCILLALASAAYALSGLWPREAQTSEASGNSSEAKDAALEDGNGPIFWYRLAIYAVALCVFGFLLPSLGYWVTTATILIVILKVAEALSWRLSVLTTAGTLLTTYVVFERLLGVPLPQGLWL